MRELDHWGKVNTRTNRLKMNNGLKIAILVSALGALVVIVASVLGFRVLPDVIKSRIEDVLNSTWFSLDEDFEIIFV